MKIKRAHDLCYPEGVLRGGDVYLEIGACKGKFLEQSKLFNRHNTYHLCEPLPDMAAKLRAKFRRKENAHVHELAVSNDNGNQAFWRTANTVGSTLFGGDGEPLDVQTITLSRAIQWWGSGPEHSIRLLAINAECAEYHILPGCPELAAVDWITVEFHPGKSQIDTRCFIERYLDFRFETAAFLRDGDPYNIWLGRNRRLWEEEEE